MKSIKMTTLFIALVAASLLFGCMSTNQHYRQTHGPKEKEMTVGTVQKEIRKGMSAADVATALGSPNIVTTDVDRYNEFQKPYGQLYNLYPDDFNAIGLSERCS